MQTSIKYANYAKQPNYDISQEETILLKVLLVEFDDVKHRSPSYPLKLKSSAYTYQDFRNLLFSENLYVSPRAYSPDSALVYGSLRDYYRLMSNNKLNLQGIILNKDIDCDNIPDWITLQYQKKYYDDNRVDQFRKESKEKAKAQGLDISTNENTFLVIIYAGHTYRDYNKKTIAPHAFVEDHEYIMGERFASGSPYREERNDPDICSVSHFSHIGIHAHELGHLLGFDDHLGGLNNEYWCLMSKGCFNGPKNEGACPAPINPYLRWKKDWIEFDSVVGISRTEIYYNLQNPQIFKLKDANSNYFFLIELRNFKAEMQFDKSSCKDYNSFVNGVTLDKGILIWRKLNGDFSKLIYSCGYDCCYGDYHIFPGISDMKVISPWSDSRVCKTGCYWIPNTKPSYNCGLEIISTENDHFVIDLFQNSPWIATPAKPKNIKSLSDTNVIITWDCNKEPDINYYKIYKRKGNFDYIFYDTSKVNYYKDIFEINDLSNN
ncbi:MAG: hypothetical protein KC414_14105, partial [Romboutsia sp.]|nr:hypothetical protein [Romboutsia sp.]